MTEQNYEITSKRLLDDIMETEQAAVRLLTSLTNQLKYAVLEQSIEGT